MPKVPQYTPAQEEEVLRLFGEGKTIADVAASLQLTVGQVNGIKRKHGLAKSRGPRAAKGGESPEDSLNAAFGLGGLDREIQLAASRIQRDKREEIRSSGASGVMRALQELSLLELKLADAEAVVEAIRGLIEEKQDFLRSLGVSIDQEKLSNPD